MCVERFDVSHLCAMFSLTQIFPQNLSNLYYGPFELEDKKFNCSVYFLSSGESHYLAN